MTYSTDRDDISAALYQRTEELHQIPNSILDGDGTFTSPAFILKDIIVMPLMITPIIISPSKDLLAISEAQKNLKTVIGLIDSDNKTNQDGKPFLDIGLEIAPGSLIKMPDGNYSGLIQGRKRVKILEIKAEEPFLSVRVMPVVEKVNPADRNIKALMKTTKNLFEQCVQYDRSIPEEANIFSMNINDPGWLADMVATAISPSYEEKKRIILLENPTERLIHINHLLAEELDVLQLEDDIQLKVQKEVDKSQREFYLREQVKAIQNELGEGDIWDQEIKTYQNKISKIGLPNEIREMVEIEIRKLSFNPALSPETGIIKNYIDWILDIPWTHKSEDNLNVNHASRILKQNHFGLNKAKERLLEYIAVKSLNPKSFKQPILCFVGPPGTGKTSLGKSIADSLGRSFVRVSLGGVRDEAEIRGHRRTYIGALPGRIIQTMKRAGTINPLFMLDEIDKLGSDFRGDPSAALLEVLDPEQNHAFSDHYLEVPYDLSQVMFITTANTTENIPSALLDRMEIIEFPGYIEEEKIEISKRFLIPRQLQENGLEHADVKINDETLLKIIRDYTFEAGVRNLEREIGKLFRKVARIKSQHRIIPDINIATTIEKFLGPPQFFTFEAESKDEVGVATAIAWTENGGEIMPVEVLILAGKGNLQITGQIGDVMQESAQAALSYIKSRARSFKIAKDRFEKIDIHIHIPEGSIHKDGPSAGITICTAIISALTKRRVYRHVGMTGEMTLRGRVLPVGGIKEKILAAHRAGLKKVIVPKKNVKDLVEIPKNARNEIKINAVDQMDQVIRIALYPDS